MVLCRLSTQGRLGQGASVSSLRSTSLTTSDARCISSHITRGFEINNETPISKSSHIVRGFERTLFISRLVGWGLIVQVLGANSPETGG